MPSVLEAPDPRDYCLKAEFVWNPLVDPECKAHLAHAGVTPLCTCGAELRVAGAWAKGPRLVTGYSTDFYVHGVLLRCKDHEKHRGGVSGGEGASRGGERDGADDIDMLGTSGHH